MDNSGLLSAITEPVYQKLLQAVETGKWLDGSPLTEQQRDTSLQAVMYYQAKNLKSDQHMTVGEDGEIVLRSRQSLQQEMKQNSTNSQTIARFKQDDL